MASSSTHHPDIIDIIWEDDDDDLKPSFLANRNFKEEPDDFVPESPRGSLLALGAPEERFGATSAKGKKFHCPFRTEDNRVCNDSNDKLTEVLCHFYARHFARTLDNDKSSKVFTPLRCFYSGCIKRFSFHHELVGHMLKHEKGKQNLWFIKYIYENLKRYNDLKISDLKALHEEDIKDFQVKVEDQAADINMYQDKLADQKMQNEMLKKTNENLQREIQDLRQSDQSKQETRMVELDKYNQLLQRYKIEKERTEVEKMTADINKRRADVNERRADLLEKSDEYWEEGPCKRKREYKEEIMK